MPSATDLPDLSRLGRAQRLALAYAPAKWRADTAALLLLDAQFADFVRSASEPVLGQMRLAWWRDRFAQSPEEWPKGNPLLAQLATWGAASAGLQSMVDGWEILLGERPLGATDIAAHAKCRAEGWRALAKHAGVEADCDGISGAAERWVLVDFSWDIAEESGRALSLETASAIGRSDRLPRALRTLSVLDGLARRSLKTHRPPLSQASDMLGALRTGLFGR